MFKFDSPIFNALTRIIDIITLNILWILCSLPIITIGASTTALYYSMLKIIRNKDSGIISMFFRSFRQNLKQGCCMIIFFGVIGVFLCVDIQACSYIEGIGRNVILTVLIIICVMVGMVYSYVFPLLAQFENSIRATLKNAFLMSFAYFFKTIVIFVLNVIPMVLFVAFPMIFIMTVPIWLIFGIALLALINAKIFAKIFDQYIEQMIRMIKMMNKNDSIRPGKPWYDTNGNRIQAHGGSMLFWNHKFYWYGENKEHVTDEKKLWHNGVRLYSSEDLYNWTDEGVICVADFADKDSPLHPYSKMDRPHIVYNEKTKMFVLWMKIMKAGNEQHMTVATAPDIKGPFRIVNQVIHPCGMNSGDFDILKREDGSAVLIFEKVHTEMICVEMTEDYLDVTAEYSSHLPRKCPPFVREAPAVFRKDDKYYIYTSGTTAKFPNPSEVASFTEIHGEWIELGDPHVGDEMHTSFDSQISCVFKYPYAKNLYIAMADRWLVDLPKDRPDIPAIYESKFDPDKYSELAKFDVYSLTAKNTSIADYVWLPVKFINGIPCLEWLDEWRIEDYLDEKDRI